MADIKKIKLGGNTYDIKDAGALRTTGDQSLDGSLDITGKLDVETDITVTTNGTSVSFLTFVATTDSNVETLNNRINQVANTIPEIIRATSTDIAELFETIPEI
jgi:hypothetical protein